jgi:hypothetical protein
MKIKLYGMIQEDRSIFWEVTVSVIVRERIYMNLDLILNFYWDTAIWFCKWKSIVNDNKERDITYCQFYSNFKLMSKWYIYYTEMTDLLQFAISVWKSHCQPQYTSQLVLFIWVDVHVSLYGQHHSTCDWTICLVYLPFFCKLHFSSNPTNKNLTELGLDICTALFQ